MRIIITIVSVLICQFSFSQNEIFETDSNNTIEKTIIALQESIGSRSIAISKFKIDGETYVGLSSESWIDLNYPNDNFLYLLKTKMESSLTEHFSPITCIEVRDGTTIFYYNFKCTSGTAVSKENLKPYIGRFRTDQPNNEQTERLEYEFLFKKDGNSFIEIIY
ncbi:hypothetical protein LY01_02179 [Nonlabens xylanidelens]|uniref:Uncharacterized protein n=1 Tax=Nonlabens xylanidelens TaxID=191564 RepID=A0A2S6IIB2_9FLAO|nr:hypothetical protein [Nonlabens xylanidelens]PPK93957.1 hypothetical protein LY01_02179 [Nonlabens xylanidelens]PQJ22113.1 hypothetical protein BST94_00615 [Nonlabens xylanidelens]